MKETGTDHGCQTQSLRLNECICRMCRQKDETASQIFYVSAPNLQVRSTNSGTIELLVLYIEICVLKISSNVARSGSSTHLKVLWKTRM